MSKAVLFDLDGVLVDACDWHYKALNKALHEIAGYEISRQDHEAIYNGLPTKVKLKALAKEGFIKESQIQDISNLKQNVTIEVIGEFCKEDISKINLIANLKDRGYKVGCVTNSIRKTAYLMLKQCGILDMLDVVITNEDVTNAKPHPEGYIKAMTTLKVKPQHTIIVEDSPKGLQAAERSGATVLEVANATEVNIKLKI